ncbi:microcystin degradation protein MlrC [Collinsella sp. An2]|nr:microcystin degradation protein MlrC [Collinsella sp. An2]
MKILVGKFTLEANEHVPMMCDIEDVAMSYGADSLTHMQLGDVFDRDDIEVVPTICADAACSGVMRRRCFDHIEGTILNGIRTNLADLDGIYLHLHGASYVECIGSGEMHLLAAIRQMVGPYLPIAVACDPHGNLTEEYVHNCTFIRSYREAPHTDIAETVQRTCRELIRFIEQPCRVTPVYRKLPLILGGEQSVSTDEPVRSINDFMNHLEEDPRILSASWHVGYLRHDCAEAGCGVVVIPSDPRYAETAEHAADELASFVWERRHEFHYTGTTAEPDEALAMALACKGRPAFITDSGDNVTSGAMGANTFVLQQVLEIQNLDQKVLFAAIHDDNTCHKLGEFAVGTTCKISLGMALDELSSPIELDVEIVAHGRQEGTHMYGEHGDYGPLATVKIVDRPVWIVITDNNHSFVEEHQLDACGVPWRDFEVIVVKQGYIHPELKAAGALSVMSLTDGATPQNTKLIKFKRIMRPMYPIDEI